MCHCGHRFQKKTFLQRHTCVDLLKPRVVFSAEMAEATRQKDSTKDSGVKEKDGLQAGTNKDTGKEPAKKTARAIKDKKVSSEKEGSGSQNQIL